MNKTSGILSALLGAGLTLMAAAPARGADFLRPRLLTDGWQACPAGQSSETCMSANVHPHFEAQMQALVPGDRDGICATAACTPAAGSDPSLGNSEQASQGFPWSPGAASGASDFSNRTGYYLLGAIPLIVLGGSALGIDHRLTYDGSGIWKRQDQLDLEYAVVLTEFGGSLWFGGENRIGRTFWQSLDASAFSALAAQGLKYVFSRARPYQSASPNHWFQGSCCQSFPSGEVTLQASFVTPFILEYHRRDPWVWGLEVLPLYDALGRMKAQGHWQTDVLSGWALGTAFGIFAHNRKIPFFLSYMPHGVMMGWQKSF